jgi:HSP20 family protein
VWNLSLSDRFNTLREQIDRLFDAPFGELARATEFFNDWAPALDLFETKDDLVVKLELPGLKKDDIDISLHDGTLTVSGERKHERKEETDETYRRERFFGRFQRTVALPKPVKAEAVKAAYRDGILTVTLPKTEEAKPKQIEVTVN